jgi:hypothetical protein
MSFSPKDSAIKVTPELKQAIESAQSTREMQEILWNAAWREQNLIAPDPLDPLGHNRFAFKPVQQPVPQGYQRSITVNGTTHTISGASEAEVTKNELALMKTLISNGLTPAEQARQTALETQARDANGRFTQRTVEPEVSADEAEQARIFKQSELERQFRLGEITSADYIRQSGALDQYLADAGIDKSALQEVSANRFNQSWAEAGAEWRKGDGSEWVGGTANQKLIGDKICELGLMDASDKVAALTQAYQALLAEGSLVENEAVAYERRIAQATTPDELRIAAGYQDPSTSSGIFGR